MKKFSEFYIIATIFLVISCTNNKNNNISNDENLQKNKILVADTVSTSKAKSINSEYEVIGGWLKLKTDQQEIIKILGTPENKDDETYLGSTGSYAQTWEYLSLGIELVMESDTSGGNKTVRSITIKSPCKLTTSQGIGIGSNGKVVKERYFKLINSSDSDSNFIFIGTIYGGTIINLKNNIVKSIFIGAAAD